MRTPNQFFEHIRSGGWVMGPGFGDGDWVVLGDGQERLSVPANASRSDIRKGFDVFESLVRQLEPTSYLAGFVSYEAAKGLEDTLNLPHSPDMSPLIWVKEFQDLRRVNAEYFSGTEEFCDLGESQITDHTNQEVYEGKIQNVIDHILLGDIFQANISRRMSAAFPAQSDMAAKMFIKMVGGHFSKYAVCGEYDGGALISNSPELFLSIDNGKVTAEPIKGTRPRGQDEVHDQKLAAELQGDVKERAENVMIADLLRNDLAKVCEDHSIVEEEICALRSLPHVHHLYSRISGTLRKDRSPIDALKASFPCGSVTGAPKLEAMNVIAALEKEGRGPYCGAIFLISGSGKAIFSVPIRTGILYEQFGRQTLDVRVGGGITALSTPSSEYVETADKSYAFKAIVS